MNKKQSIYQGVLVDVMKDGRFLCQLRIPQWITENNRQMEAYIEEKRPSLKGQKYHIEFTEQVVWR